MKETEYFERKNSIESNARRLNDELQKEFALSNNPYKCGDIISDHSCTIRIDLIRVAIAYGENLPKCRYEGFKINKDGELNKRGDREMICQSNIHP